MEIKLLLLEEEALISNSKKDIDLAKYYSTQAREKIYYEHKKLI